MLSIREKSQKRQNEYKVSIYRKQINVSGYLGLGRGGLHTGMRDLLCDENISMLILVVAA